MKKCLLPLFLLLSLSVGCHMSAEVSCQLPFEDVLAPKEEITIGYVPWSYANAHAHLMKAVLEDHYPVHVNLTEMDAPTMWESIADGQVDIITGFLPCTHALYYNQLEGKVADLGPMFSGARNGLVVPSYVTIDSIEELNDNADKFNGHIVGIDPGAGVMYRTIIAKSEYELKDLELIQSSDAEMTKALQDAYENGEWIVVTGWEPHWKFDNMDLKFLDDPKNIYCDNDRINVITRRDFDNAQPDINAFLDSHSLTQEEYHDLMNYMEASEDDNEAAKEWIRDNQGLVDSWFS